MVTYESKPQQLPWPYSDLKSGDERCAADSKCFIFQCSDSYQRDCKDYENVQMSGDANMLALFCAHHPYSIPCLLQLYVTGMCTPIFFHGDINVLFSYLQHQVNSPVSNESKPGRSSLNPKGTVGLRMLPLELVR